MSELVKRLREGTYASYDQCTDAWLAADRIDALEAENKALREGLREILNDAEECPSTRVTDPFIVSIQDRARALLAKEKVS